MDAKQHSELTVLMAGMAKEVHTMKGHLAANTSFMKDYFERLEEKIDHTDERVDAVVASASTLLEAFPLKDTDAHRQYHQAIIEWRELRNKIVREALIKAGQAGLLAGAGILAAAIWQAFKISVKQ